MRVTAKLALYSILVLLLLSLLGCSASATGNLNPILEANERKLIVDSIYNYDYAGSVNTVGKDTTVTVQNPEYVSDMITSANVGASKVGGSGALMLTPNSSDTNSFQVIIKSEAFKKLIAAASNKEISQFSLSHSLGSIRFIDLEEISSLESGNFEYKIQNLTGDFLTANVSKINGNRPIRAISLSINSKSITSTNDNLQLNIPYTASENEVPNQLILYRVSDNGDIKPIVNSLYKKITDETGNEQYIMQAIIKESGVYAIGYNNVLANDILSWSEPYVNFVMARKIMNANGQNRFMPNQFVTRSELVSFLYNINDCQINNKYGNIFFDVDKEHPCANAIAWACSTGVITGYADGSFKPNQLIARQEMAAMLHRYSQLVAKTYLPETVVLKGFKDDNIIDSFTKNAVYDLQQAGILNGRDDNCFMPLDNVTRAECAKMIAQLISGIMDGKAKFVSLN